jgi:hypothetical protein
MRKKHWKDNLKIIFASTAPGGSDVTPPMATRSAIMHMAVIWHFCVLKSHSTKSVIAVELDIGRKFHENAQGASSTRFLGFTGHFSAMSTVALLLVIVGLTSLLQHATRKHEFFQWCKFNSCKQFCFC